MSLRNPSQFSLWKEENIDASCLLKIRTNTENSPEKVFQARRAGVHSRMLVALSGYASIINARLEETNGKIQKMRRTKIHHVGDKVVGKRKMMQLRKIKFLQTEVLSLKNQYLTWRQQFWKTKQRQAASFVNLFGGSTIPKAFVFSVSEDFFIQDMPGERQMKERIRKFKVALKNMLAVTNTEPTSSFARDFDSALTALSGRGIEQMDPESKVIPILKGEDMFARAVLQGETGEMIDEFVKGAIADGFAEFAVKAPQLCCQLVDGISGLPVTAQSVALSLYYRVVVNRAYELYRGDLFEERVPSIFHAKMSDFVMLAGVKPVGEETDSVRDVFARDEEFRQVADEFTRMAFLVDPIDVLFSVRTAISKIHEIAMKRKSDTSESNQLMAFDDVFGLLIGSLIASDCPDPVTIYKRTTSLLGRQAISSILEFAMSNLEALTIEVTSWDEKRAKSSA